MAEIYGVYHDGKSVPEEIGVKGTEDEINRVAESIEGKTAKTVRGSAELLDEAPSPENPHPPVVEVFDFIRMPADKSLVRDITSTVEVECDDPRLIDWMRDDA